jgi:glycine/sarcosine N-methyltransferase
MDTVSATEFYDRLARAFDVMTDWTTRLNHEMPFIEKILARTPARSVLDIACGTGWHTIALARRGYTAAGYDASPAMIEQARVNAARASIDVPFQVADFSQVEKIPGAFGAILCLGNSLPHLLCQGKFFQAFRQMQTKLKPGGVLILHNLNYDLRLKTKPRFFAVEGKEDMLVWRFADYGADLITFHTALFERSPSQPPKWSVQVNSTLQKPWLAGDYRNALMDAGFRKIECFGGLDGSPYEEEKSGDLVIVADLSGGAQIDDSLKERP